MNKIKFIDLFCGAGGVTTGIEKARFNKLKCAEVIACVNHDPLAIESHAANHPKPHHFTEDIRTLDVSKLPTKKDFPNDLLCLWASLECTNFSKAKGGKPRDQDSRTLAEHLYERAVIYDITCPPLIQQTYIPHIDPDYIHIENVREFMAWGPLDENGKPHSMKNGRDYLKWVYRICDMGYTYDFRLLNAADYGAHTSRIRYFGCFAKKGLPIIFPDPTHQRDSKHGLKKWKAVREVLNLHEEGESIFTRAKPLAEKTLERIYAGLIKFVAGGKENFMTHFHGGDPSTKVWSTDGPTRTISKMETQQIVTPHFITKYFSGKPDGKNISIDGPAGSITTGANQALVKSCFLAAHYSNGANVSSIDSPSPTVSVKDRFALIQSKFWIDRNFTDGGGKTQSIELPAGAILSIPKMNLVEAKWLMDTSFNNIGSDLNSPAPVITANRKQHYIMNPLFDSKGSSIDAPLGTITGSRRHWHYLIDPQWFSTRNGYPAKSIEQPSGAILATASPPYLVSTETGDVAILIFETDSEFTINIKEFMAMYGIADIKMRMLQVEELKLITGFSKNYFLAGSKTHQKKFIGNAVPPIIPQRWIEALYARVIANHTPVQEKFLLSA